MDTEKKRAFIIDVVYYAILAIIIYFVVKYALAWLMPFILAFVLVTILQMIVKPIKKRFKLKNEKLTIIVLLLIYILIGAGLSLLIFKLIMFLGDVLENSSTIINLYIIPTLSTLTTDIENILGKIDPQILSFLDAVEKYITQFLTSLSGYCLELVKDFVAKIPSFFISSIVMIISSFFIAIDYRHINAFIMAQCSSKVKAFMMELKDYTVNTLFQIILAYIKLMIITFLELSIGFIILRIDNPFLIALLIAVFDVLPVFGTGGIMIPWVLYLFINKDFSLGIGLLILYLIITVIRNIIEPRIVGKQVGIHPLLMLISMFAGVKVFGILGLLICPVAIIIIMNLNESGKIHLYNLPKKEE